MELTGFKRSVRLPKLDLADVAVLAIFAGLVIVVAELAVLLAWWAGLAFVAAALILWGMQTLRIMIP